MSDFSPDFLFSTVTDVHFLTATLSISATGITSDNQSAGVGTPSISITPVGAPQGILSFRKLSDNVTSKSTSSPGHTIPQTTYTIWNPAVPLPDSSNISNQFSTLGISFVGQFMALHPNIAQDLLQFDHVVVNPGGTFKSLSDARAALKYMPQTTADSWFDENGKSVPAAFINNFAAEVDTVLTVSGASSASKTETVVYEVPLHGSFSVTVSCPGPSKLSSVSAILAVDNGGDTGGASSQASATFLVTFNADPKNATVTVTGGGVVAPTN